MQCHPERALNTVSYYVYIMSSKSGVLYIGATDEAIKQKTKELPEELQNVEMELFDRFMKHLLSVPTKTAEKLPARGSSKENLPEPYSKSSH